MACNTMRTSRWSSMTRIRLGGVEFSGKAVLLLDRWSRGDRSNVPKPATMTNLHAGCQQTNQGVRIVTTNNHRPEGPGVATVRLVQRIRQSEGLARVMH